MDGANLAHSKAIELAGLNPILGGQALDANAFQLGTWSEADGFQAVNMPPSEAQAKKINAMRVANNYSGIPAILAGVAYKQDTLSTAAAAMAVRSVGGPAGSVDCYLPIALPSCAFDEEKSSLVVGPGNQDTMGWVVFGGEPASNSNVDNVLLNGDCGNGVAVDDDNMRLRNGVGNNASTIKEILNGQKDSPFASHWLTEMGTSPPERDGISTFCHPDDTVCSGTKGNTKPLKSAVTAENWGRVIGGAIAIVGRKDGEDSCNENGKPNWEWNNGKNGASALEVKGFSWAYIYDVNQDNGNGAAVYIKLDFGREYEYGTGTHPEAVGNIVVKGGPPKLVAP